MRKTPPLPRHPRRSAVPGQTAPAGGLNLNSRLVLMNRWREYYNPLERLSLRRASALLHASQLGLWADLQWTYKFIEERDPTLMALIERRAGALVQLDHECHPCPDHRLPPGASPAEAGAQAEVLRAAYENLENLREAVEFLALAGFRGFSHLEKIRDASGAVTRLDPVEQWHWTRKSSRSPWLYNASALQTNEGIEVDPRRFVIRETPRPINPLALITYVRKGLSQKNWDAFVEIYGLPGAIVIGPPELPKEQEQSYEASAESIATGGTGYLPHGSDVKFSASPRQTNPFHEHIRNLDEHLVLAGTGGLLTMLAVSGAGTLAGGAHQKTFETIARAEARKISEVFQRQFDAEILEARFPGRPRLAYFELAGDEEPDPAEVIDQVLKLSQAGLEADPAQITERTGYRLSRRNPPPADTVGFRAGPQADAGQPLGDP